MPCICLYYLQVKLLIEIMFSFAAILPEIQNPSLKGPSPSNIFASSDIFSLVVFYVVFPHEENSQFNLPL